MKLENLLNSNEFVQMSHELFKSKKEEVSELEKQQIKVENDCDSKEDTDSDRWKFEGTSEGDLKMQEEQYDVDSDHKVLEYCDPLIIKKENANTENVSASTTNFTETWIKCEAVEGLKLENNLDTETCGITEIREEYIIKNENDHILKHPIVLGGYKLHVCIHCNATFRKNSSLDDHMIKKHPESITSVLSKIHECQYCVFKTVNKSNLSRHMGKHPEAKGGCEPKMCIHCDAKFKSKASLDDHVIKKHPEDMASVTSKIHECKYCEFKTTARSNLRSHVGKHPGAEGGWRKTCIHCNRTFSNKICLHDHIVRNHPGYITTVSSKVYECIYCVHKTTSKCKFDRHMLKHRDFAPDVSSKMYECAHCTYKTVLKSSLAIHLLKHPGANSTYKLKKCVHCNATFKTGLLLGNHIIKKHPDFVASISSKIHECTHCTYKTTFKSLLTKHMFKHPDAKGSHKLIVCSHCNTTCIKKKSLNDHIEKKHPEHTASVSSKIFECKYCAFKTMTKGYLTRHMSKHPGTEGYALKTCLHCNAAFKSRKTLDNHTVKKHPKHIESVSGTIYKCTHCTYKNTIKIYLNNHIIKTQPEYIASVSGKIHECIHCSYKTTFKRELDNHIIKSHPEHIATVSSKIHECPQCTYKTAVKRDFNSHVCERYMEKHRGR